MNVFVPVCIYIQSTTKSDWIQAGEYIFIHKKLERENACNIVIRCGLFISFIYWFKKLALAFGG